MDLKRIRHALAVGDELNFARAAARVHLTQPALSRSIQTLEDELGIRLFDRDHHSVELSPMGRIFLERARQLAADAHRLQQDMQMLRSRSEAEVAFGCGPTAAGLLPAIMRQWRHSHPGLHIQLHENSDALLLQALRHERIEFFIGDTSAPLLPLSDKELQITPLAQLQSVFICRVEHPLSGLRTWSPHALLQFGLASPPLEPHAQQRLRSFFDLSEDQALPLAIECSNLYLLKQLIQDSNILLLAPSTGPGSNPHPQRWRELTLSPALDWPAQVGVIRYRGKTLSPAAEMLITSLRQTALDGHATPSETLEILSDQPLA